MNGELFNKIEQALRSGPEFSDQDELYAVRRLFQRPLQKSQRSSQEQFITVRGADFTIRELLTAIPACRWPGTGFDFPLSKSALSLEQGNHSRAPARIFRPVNGQVIP
jgi:hypothetical protein